MGTNTVPIARVWAMLEHCARGHEKTRRERNWSIAYNGREYPSFPLGDDIAVGFVEQLAGHLQIAECARSFLPMIRQSPLQLSTDLLKWGQKS